MDKAKLMGWNLGYKIYMYFIVACFKIKYIPYLFYDILHNL